MSSIFYMLTTPQFFLLAQTSPPNFRIIYPQIKLVQRDHLISTSSLCPPLPSLSHMGKRHSHPPSSSSEGPNSHLRFTLFFTLSIESASKTSLVHFQMESNHFLPLHFPTLVQATISSHVNICPLIYSAQSR